MRHVLMAAAVLLAGCAAPETDILKHPLVSGETLAQRLPPRSPAVALLIDPADIVLCGNHISRWMEWDRRNPGHLAVVLTRPPTEPERKQLVLFRVRTDAVLRKTRRFEPVPTPYEYLVSDGTVVLSEQVAPGSPESPLLRAFEGGQAAALLSRSTHRGR